MKQRVVITGTGMITPLGHNVEDVWKNLLACKSGIERTKNFDAQTFPTNFSAEVKNFNIFNFLSDADKKKHKNADRNSSFILGAALQAWEQAGLPKTLHMDANDDTTPRADRVGVYLGAGEGPPDFDNFIRPTAESWNKESRTMDWKNWADVALKCMRPIHELQQEPNMSASHIAHLFKLRGLNMSCLTACAASTQAIGEASDLIRHGDADIIIAGGTHSMIHPLGITGFNRLTALSTRNDDHTTASRPFDDSRDGFVIAEGSGIIILESLDSAIKRGVPILAEVTGYGSTADAFRVTDQHDEGRGGIAAVELALETAGLTPDKIDYISAHGTGTAENDSIETHVIKTVFGKHAKNTPISSVKSSLGHLIAAAGVVELITCILAIRDNIIPPTLNLNTPDPALDLDYVPNTPRKQEVNIAMSNSFGFGGQNNTIIIEQYRDNKS